MVIFDVAISFAGEDRTIVKQLVKLLKQKGLSVFYDYDYQDDLVGKDLYQHLYKIYKDSALFFLPIISNNYIKKPWAMHELKAAQEREFYSDTEYILPIILDNIEVPGIPSTKGNLNLNQFSLSKISTIIKKKVDKRKNSLFFEQEQLYGSIMHSFEFLANRFCLLSQTSKAAEFAHLPAIIDQFKLVMDHIKYKLNKEFSEIILLLLEDMKMEQDEHINGLDEKSLFLKQYNFRISFNTFKQAYIGFTACKYNESFVFTYYIEQQNKYFPQKERLLDNIMDEFLELIKQEIEKPLTAAELYRECLKIALLDNWVSLDAIDLDELLNELLMVFPKELLDDFENSIRINEEAYNSLKNAISKK